MIEVSLNSGQQVLLKFKNIVSEVVAKDNYSKKN